MLNFDQDRFVRIQSSAVALADEIHDVIADAVAGGAANLYFAGTGGAGILMLPAARLLQARSRFPVLVEYPAELVVGGSAQLGAGSMVIIPSLSGTTPESVRVMEYCQRIGARTFTLTGNADTPLGQAAAHNFTNFAEDDTSSESFYIQALLIALSLMDTRDEIADYAGLVSELKLLPPLLLEAKRNFEPQAQVLAQSISGMPYHILTGAGSAWPEAFYYGMCILEEMQWIRTRPVHAADFFHGTLELLESGVSLILLQGEDEYRPLADRVKAFARERTDSLSVIDTALIPLPGISPELRTLISPIILATLLERVSAHLEVIRDHPLATRRYYKRVSY
jgi:fructoselysine-6-phosphate deglycase